MKKQGAAQVISTDTTETRDILTTRKAFDFKSHTEIRGEDTNRSTFVPKVSPLDFVNYLPFLCSQLQLPFNIVIRRTDIGKYNVTDKARKAYRVKN